MRTLPISIFLLRIDSFCFNSPLITSIGNNLLNNLTDFPKNKLTIKTINSKSHILSSGPYSTINLLKNDYIKIINFGFEDLDVKLYE